MPTLSTANPHLDHAAMARLTTETERVRPSTRQTQTEITPALDEAPGFQTIELPPAQPAPENSPSSNSSTQIQEMREPQAASNPMRGNFAHRHPKLTKALGRIAAAAVFATTIVPLSIAYGIATPVRLAYELATAIYPAAGRKFTNSSILSSMLGQATREAISPPRAHMLAPQTPPNRLNSLMILCLDLGSGGTTYTLLNSGFSAYKIANAAYRKTQTALGPSHAVHETRTALGPSHAAHIPQTAVELINALNERQAIQPQTHGAIPLQRQAIQNQIYGAIPLHTAIDQWFNILGDDETPKTGLDEKVWKAYESKSRSNPNYPKASSLASLLFQMQVGFRSNFAPSTNPKTNQENNAKLKAFVNERLLPVLLRIQGSEKVANTAFRLAEIGLGACSDRAVFGWLAVELGTKSAMHAEEYLALSKQKHAHSEQKINALCKLAEVEIQTYMLDEVKKQADFLIRDEQRDPRGGKGGWQLPNTQYTAYKDLDHVETYLTLCKRVRELMPEDQPGAYPKIPYVIFNSGLGRVENKENEDNERIASLKILENLKPIADDPSSTKYVEHLLTMDAWKEVMACALPSSEKVKKEQLQLCENAMSQLYDLMGELTAAAKARKEANPKKWNDKDELQVRATEQAYEAAAKALDVLYKKFDGGEMSEEDACLPLNELIQKQLALCEPALAKERAKSIDFKELFLDVKAFETQLKEFTAMSPIVEQAVKKARAEFKPGSNPPIPLDKRMLARQAFLLKKTQIKVEKLEIGNEPAVHAAIQIAMHTDKAEMLRVLDSIDKWNGQVNDYVEKNTQLETALEQIALQKSTIWDKADDDRKQFTLGFVKSVKMGLSGYTGPKELFQ
jgi:hypothetical protein